MFKTIFSILLCIISIIVLVVIYLLYKGVKLEEIFKNGHLSSDISSHEKNSTLQHKNVHKDVNNVNHYVRIDQLKELNKSIAELSKRVDSLEQRFSKELNEMKSSMNKMTKEIDVVKPRVSNRVESTGTVQHRKVISSKNLNSRASGFPKTMFAQYADRVNPVGFSDEGLKDSAKGCCYLIKIKSSKDASFTFIDNAELKKNAVQAFSTIIERSCCYDSGCLVTDNFITLKDGRLEKEGNLWKITSKTEIKFI